MNAVTETFKAKLLAVVSDYMFNEDRSNPHLAREVYNSINKAFASIDADNYVSSGQAKQLPSYASDALANYASGGTEIKPAAWPRALEKSAKLAKKNPNSLSGQIEAKINDVIDIVNDCRRLRVDGEKGTRVDWETAASEIYNRLNIRTQQGSKPKPRQFADAFNHLMMDNRKGKI